MADTIQPWIEDYLIELAETYGANVGGFPVHNAGKKVQLVEFLTFQAREGDDCIWAKVSDKRQRIAVRFSSKALTEYAASNQNDSQGKRLTQHKNAVIIIKAFRLMFQRIPVGNGQEKMTSQEHLFLLVDSMRILGSREEATFGSPQDPCSHAELKLWIDGLRKGGGDGNVLKNLKQTKQEAVSAGPSEAKPSQTSTHQLETIQQRPIPPLLSIIGVNGASRKNEYMKSWGIYAQMHRRYEQAARDVPISDDTSIQTHPASSMGPPVSPSKSEQTLARRPPKKGALDFSSPSNIGTPAKFPHPSRPKEPTTPTEWPSSSPLRSPSFPNGDNAPSSPISSHSSSPLSSPESRHDSLPTVGIFPPYAEAHHTPSSSLAVPTLAQRQRRLAPSSSYPPTSSVSALHTVPAMPVNKRKVPPPRAPIPQSDTAARGEILVPNSDTSGDLWQSQELPSQCVEGSDVQRAVASNRDDAVFGYISKTVPSRPSSRVREESSRKSGDRSSVPLEAQDPSQDNEFSSHMINDVHFDDLSRVAVKGSQADAVELDDAEIDPKRQGSVSRTTTKLSANPQRTSSFKVNKSRQSPSVVEGTPEKSGSLPATDAGLSGEATKRQMSPSPSVLLSRSSRKKVRHDDSRDQNWNVGPSHSTPSNSPSHTSPAHENADGRQDLLVSQSPASSQSDSVIYSQLPPVEDLGAPSGKLKGFRVDLTIKDWPPNEPPLINWTDLSRIIARTEQLRAEEK
ncbi:hypothetical protein BV25DRAFT_1912851 [Artomyces pyxidatus]|uniref:Uncharacterized protein n=1 Tax=Artomyces pyxidatus TaxID=48021 RepID=A0ACB8TBU7_9AGAM|nr:hypothetical protein BV25DRAFT_1912851 [Artomyces pyxidatus]